jgi:hypothetical protein
MKSVSRIVRKNAHKSMNYIYDKTKSSVSNLVDDKIYLTVTRKILQVNRHICGQYRNEDEIS